jgi:transcriptional regulator with XRE-family HTH domain
VAPSHEESSRAGQTAPVPFTSPLRARRLQLGLTIAELAARSGVGHATIERAEYGIGHPYRSVRLLLAAALDADVDDLFPPAGERGPRGDAP